MIKSISLSNHNSFQGFKLNNLSWVNLIVGFNSSQLVKRISKVKSKNIIIIDELERDVPYARLFNLWTALFSCPVNAGVQFFITTHNMEFMKTFCDVALIKENRGLATYIELTKCFNTNKIIPIMWDIKAVRKLL